MSALPSPGERSRPRIVDLVFAGDAGRPGGRLLACVALTAASYIGLGSIVVARRPSASSGSIEGTAQIHDLVSAARPIDMASSPPPPLAAPQVPHLAVATASAEPASRSRHRSPPASARSRPAGPTRAGAIVTAAEANRPVDFTGLTFVVGSSAPRDPGHAFAQAARACAFRTQFQPAHDASGVPIAAISPSIRVHFFR